MEAWKDVSGTAGQSASVVLAGDPRLVGLAQQQFSAGGTLPGSWARPLAELSTFSSVPGEVLVVFARPEEEGEVLDALAHANPKGKAIVAVDEGPDATNRAKYPGNRCILLSFADTPAGWAGSSVFVPRPPASTRRLWGGATRRSGRRLRTV